LFNRICFHALEIAFPLIIRNGVTKKRTAQVTIIGPLAERNILGDISINPFLEDMIFGEFGFHVKTPDMKI
jgi:hypothetical protein